MDKPRILYIDDDDGILISAKFLIGDICDLITERSPQKAVESLQNEKYDIIFLDLSMPEWDGVEVLKVLKKNYPQIPVFMVSGWTGGDTRLQEAKALGANGFITKPFNREAIKKEIEAVKKK